MKAILGLLATVVLIGGIGFAVLFGACLYKEMPSVTVDGEEYFIKPGCEISWVAMPGCSERNGGTLILQGCFLGKPKVSFTDLFGDHHTLKGEVIIIRGVQIPDK